ncbi:MAG: TrmH family RNA methyltransferase, partial [Rhodoplanes sp.]
MPGAGTDKTKTWVAAPGPVVILVEPQLGENIGAAARVMANFGLSRLRIVNPKQGWPNPKARMMAAGA